MATSEFLSGVVEGFYGRPWDFELRRAYADFLSASQLNACLYCPKADPWLRKRWAQAWPPEDFRALQELADHYRSRHVLWGVGLSPFELYRHYGAPQREQLRRKLDSINQLQAPLLAILFDDMPGELDALASRQADIVADVRLWCPEARILVCPTYYSFDPVLEKHFGAMPADYWPQLGAELPSGVDVFWTGNAVCSERITLADVQRAQAQLGRPVILWDNYPVNDGAVRSNCLYLNELPARGSDLGEALTGHLCNPMNQGWLSLPALLGLARLYGSRPDSAEWVRGQLGADTWAQLRIDQEEFLALGLAGMGTARRRELSCRYRALPGPAAAEVVAWLDGEYTWDPACLTD